MEEGTDILEHINKVKSLADQLLVLEVPLRGEDVVMTLLDSLPSSFKLFQPIWKPTLGTIIKPICANWKIHRKSATSNDLEQLGNQRLEKS